MADEHIDRAGSLASAIGTCGCVLYFVADGLLAPKLVRRQAHRVARFPVSHPRRSHQGGAELAVVLNPSIARTVMIALTLCARKRHPLENATRLNAELYGFDALALESTTVPGCLR